MRGGGSTSGTSNRHRPRCARGRGECGLLARLPSRGLRATRGAAPGGRRRRRAVWPLRSAVPSGATREGSRRATRWLGLDCCTFFFVRCIFRNKKKSPTLHTTSSASLSTRSLATSVWGYRDHCLPRTLQPGWVGRALVLRPMPGLQLEHNQNRLTVAPPARPQPRTCIFSGFRLNTSGPILRF